MGHTGNGHPNTLATGGTVAGSRRGDLVDFTDLDDTRARRLSANGQRDLRRSRRWGYRSPVNVIWSTTLVRLHDRRLPLVDLCSGRRVDPRRRRAIACVCHGERPVFDAPKLSTVWHARLQRRVHGYLG